MTGNVTLLRQFLVLVSLLGALLVACHAASDASPLDQTLAVSRMKLESKAFAADGTIPSKYTCDGQDISPPLSWDTPPAGTQSLALIVDDPDAPRGIFVHWVLYDLPPEIRELPEGIPADPTLTRGGVQGKNDFGNLGYGGPCPPSGTHRYFFKLYALDRVLDLTSGATKSQLEAAIDRHILGQAELIGRYSRQR